ncbi:hypothetical protein [Fimbriimonas ginsengisoli]|uniref:DUF4129 domain-containing protein n=1 Tax=Fimbriimonas ginsengisoli Gsoil 348 TaxID=661478 RepID=A0A068NYH0_FIMGI|nr:hypothetical protein [Fimbriimonas ginsengisoli]AIE88125.1 hypothetical protein OP10G_4757 [Fimbriimonas ginsengisoli Gsoil 348]
MSFAWSSDFASLAKRVHAAPTDEAAIGIVRSDPDALNDPDISSELNESGSSDKETRATLQSMLELRSMNEGAVSKADPSGVVKQIKNSPFYSDAGVAEGSNWLGAALERLKNLRFNMRPPNVDAPNVNLSWITYVMWGALAAAVGFLIFLGVKHFSWKGQLARKAKAVLEDDEPERTLDEWLKAADEFAAQGAYREAVRALYLACLLRFDEHRVARFDRHETNWEHLSRIHASSRRPAGLDFGPPTKAFDRIWYGKRTEGMPDVDLFRNWYLGLSKTLKEGSA